MIWNISLKWRAPEEKITHIHIHVLSKVWSEKWEKRMYTICKNSWFSLPLSLCKCEQKLFNMLKCNDDETKYETCFPFHRRIDRVANHLKFVCIRIVEKLNEPIRNCLSMLRAFANGTRTVNNRSGSTNGKGAAV